MTYPDFHRPSRFVAVLGILLGFLLFGAAITRLFNACVVFYDVSSLNTRRVWTPKKEELTLAENQTARIVEVGRRKTYKVFFANFTGEKRYVLLGGPNLPETLVLLEDQRELKAIFQWEQKFGGDKVFFLAPSKWSLMASIFGCLVVSSVALVIVVGALLQILNRGE